MADQTDRAVPQGLSQYKQPQLLPVLPQQKQLQLELVPDGPMPNEIRCVTQDQEKYNNTNLMPSGASGEDVVEGRPPLHIRLKKYKEGSFPQTCIFCFADYVQKFCDMFDIDTSRVMNDKDLKKLAAEYNCSEYSQFKSVLDKHALHVEQK